MKAILVVDIPDDYKIDELCVNYQIYKNDDITRVDWRFNQHLKPMPKKKETRNAIQYRGLAEEYRKEGWNECLDEILGEK
jgi:hypothetical protein